MVGRNSNTYRILVFRTYPLHPPLNLLLLRPRRLHLQRPASTVLLQTNNTGSGSHQTTRPLFVQRIAQAIVHALSPLTPLPRRITTLFACPHPTDIYPRNWSCPPLCNPSNRAWFSSKSRTPLRRMGTFSVPDPRLLRASSLRTVQGWPPGYHPIPLARLLEEEVDRCRSCLEVPGQGNPRHP